MISRRIFVYTTDHKSDDSSSSFYIRPSRYRYSLIVERVEAIGGWECAFDEASSFR